MSFEGGVISAGCFVASLAVLLRWPNVVPSLQKQPLYLHNVIVEDEALISSAAHEMWTRKRMYFRWCRLMLNVTTACLIAGCCEYGYTLWERQDEPTSYVEVCGVLGGVLSLLSRTQNVSSRILLKLCHLAQAWDERRRRVASMTLQTISTPMVDSGSSTDAFEDYFMGE